MAALAEPDRTLVGGLARLAPLLTVEDAKGTTSERPNTSPVARPVRICDAALALALAVAEHERLGAVSDRAPRGGGRMLTRGLRDRAL
ncbi:MAG: hypothetical protein M3P44_17145 [Actinomycetota bacterium]|nr:hypothetical protein [Actinomycetota bacterium]